MRTDIYYFSGTGNSLAVAQGIADELGNQAALGYLARVAASLEHHDQALLLAEESLEVGRRIADRYGQCITLQLQLAGFGQLYRPFLSVYKLAFVFGFELGKLLGYGGLADYMPFSGPGQAAEIDKVTKHLQSFDVHYKFSS